MPPRLREAQGEYHVVYTSPLARSQRAQEASGFLRTVESALQIAGQTGDHSVMNVFAYGRAFPAIAEIQNVPIDFMATDEEIKAKEQQQQQAAQQQAQIQSMPGQAAMINAQSKAQKSNPNAPPQQGQQPQGAGAPPGMGPPGPMQQ
jgi:hypothetical protein